MGFLEVIRRIISKKYLRGDGGIEPMGQQTVQLKLFTLNLVNIEHNEKPRVNTNDGRG
jgi:hypothetical protein